MSEYTFEELTQPTSYSWEEVQADTDKGLGVAREAIGDILGALTSPAVAEASAMGRREIKKEPLRFEKGALEKEGELARAAIAAAGAGEFALRSIAGMEPATLATQIAFPNAGPVLPPETAIRAVEFMDPFGVAPAGSARQGAQQFVGETASGLTSPGAALALTAGKYIPATRPYVGRYFQLPMVQPSGEAVGRLSEAQTPSEAVKAGLETALTVGAPLGIERGLAPRPGPVVPPITGRALPMPRVVEPWRRPAFQMPDAVPIVRTVEPVPKVEPKPAPIAVEAKPTPAAPTEPSVPPVVEPAKVEPAKEPWQMTLGDFVESPLNAPKGKWVPPPGYHRALVEKAITEGKPVPPEVLADYLDLKPNLPPAKLTTAEAEAAKSVGLTIVEPPSRKRPTIDIEPQPPTFDIEAEGKAMGLRPDQIEQAKREGVTNILGLRRIEKNSRQPQPPSKVEPAKEPWQMSAKEYARFYHDTPAEVEKVGNFPGLAHKQYVREAIREGKIFEHPDYPDLTPSKQLTPLQKQWRAIKDQVPHRVVLVRLGDFYEAFYGDAKTLSEVGRVALTKRNEVPMAGVPYHAVESYIRKLREAGHEVEVVEDYRTWRTPEPSVVKEGLTAQPPAAEGGKAKVDSYVEGLGLGAMQAGKLRSTLNAQTGRRTQDGRTFVGSRSEVVERMLGDGYVPKESDVPAVKEPTRTQWNRMDGRQQEAFERRKAEAGTKKEYTLENGDGDSIFTITKAEYDYANHLNKQAAPQPTPSVSPAVEKVEAQKVETISDRDREFLKIFPDPLNTGEIRTVRDQSGRIVKSQKEMLARMYKDYDPKRHDAFVDRYNYQLGEARRVAYEINRGITKSPTPPATEAIPAGPTKAPQPLMAPEDHGIMAPLRRKGKWSGATDPTRKSEAGFVTLAPIKDLVDWVGPKIKASINAVREATRENLNLQRATDFRRSILNWSGKMQESFSEAAQAQNEIRGGVKDPIRREAITNWIQAGGDPTILANRLAATRAWRDPITRKPHPQAKRLVAGYEAALNLTPEELTIARDVKDTYDDLASRGTHYDVLHSFKDNYVTQVWDLGKSPRPAGTSRKLRDKFRFDKASTFDTFFDGEQAGYVPKTKDISRLLPMYLHEMNSVIAARQLVEQMGSGTASDGRPLLAPRGIGITVAGGSGPATLVLPSIAKSASRDYVIIENQPALHEWRWMTKDAAGNPVFSKSDLMVHPEAAAHFKNVLGRSVIREWYDSKTSAGAAIPKGIVKAIDSIQSETKRLMLGVLTPFHQVQEGTHAIGHKVNPFFNNPEVDLVHNAAQRDAARHGLMLLPDRVSADHFMEGFRQSAIVSHIPGIGPLADHYSYYLFHEYIPGIKFKTYEAILRRNTERFANDIRTGSATLEDVKILSAEQANAAYGHLNYADLGRNPTIAHLARLALLAPDFLEARARFAGQAIKGLAGGRVGREQLIALATLAVAQASLSWMMAEITGGEWDPKDPFTFHVGNRKFTMRSVPEDIYRGAKDARAFWYARLNPLIGRGLIQYSSGVDWRGRKVTGMETSKELLSQPVPLALRPLIGLGNTSLGPWEELASAAGLKISRYSAANDVHQIVKDWEMKSEDPAIVERAKAVEHTVYPESAYRPLRDALERNDTHAAQNEYEKLLTTHSSKQILHAMRPYEGGTITADGRVTPRHNKPFTGSLKNEKKFLSSITPEQRALYDAALAERERQYQKFLALPR